MAAQKEKEPRFDQVKLQGMHEPLTVRVEKMRGNVRQPIELPSKGSEQTGFSPPGTNWTRDEVLGLENFILTKWSGGGYYEFTVTDAKGDRMTWQGVWDPRLYPERIPPNTAEAAVVGASPTSIPIAGPQAVPNSVQPFGTSMQGGWPPNGNQMGYNNPPHTGPMMGAGPAMPQQAPTPPAPQAPPMWNGQQPQGYPQGYPQPGYPQFGPQPGYGYGGPQPGYNYGAPQPQQFGPAYGVPSRSRYGFDDEYTPPRRGRGANFSPFDSNDDDKKEVKELERKLQQAEMERKELEYKQAIERQQQQHAQQMAQLQDEMRRLGEGRNKGEDEEVRRLREEREQERQRAQAEQAAMQRQIMEQQLLAMRQANEAQMAALRDQLARMSEAPKGETDEFRRIREEQDRQAREFERQRQEQERRLEVERAERERERERYDRERRDEMMQRELKETREATERRFEQMQAASQNNKHDPMIEMLKENARASSENMREIARMQQLSTDKMSAFMVAPAQLAAIMKDNNTGADGVIRNIIGSVSEIGNLYKNAAETIMQMSGGGGDPPAVRMIQEGVARASEVAERFLAVKRDQVVSEAKVKTAEAQRDTTRIQAETQLRTQQMYAQAQAQRPQQQWRPPPPVVNAPAGAGLGGTQAHAQAAPQAAQQAPRPSNTNGQAAAQPRAAQPAQPTHVGPIDPYAQPAPTTPVHVGPIDPYPPPPPPPNSTGPSEEEVFGMALESVLRLRRGVAEGKLTPDKTVDAILQGVEHVVSNNLVIPAFALFQQERWADFIDLMLPEAPQDFRIECVRILLEEVEVAEPGEGGEA